MANNTELLERLNDILINESKIESQEKVKREKIQAEMDRFNTIYHSDHSLRDRLGEYKELQKINFETEDIRAKVLSLENQLAHEVQDAERISSQSVMKQHITNPFLIVLGVLLILIGLILGGIIGFVIGFVLAGTILGKAMENSEDIKNKKEKTLEYESIKDIVTTSGGHLVYKH